MARSVADEGDAGEGFLEAEAPLGVLLGQLVELLIRLKTAAFCLDNLWIIVVAVAALGDAIAHRLRIS